MGNSESVPKFATGQSMRETNSTTASFRTRAPVLLRPRNYQWYWNSAADPWSSQAKEQWKKYTDVENEIIEDAYNAKKEEVEIDGNYVVNLKHVVQCKKDDKNRQRRIQRVQLQEDRSNVHLREERFSFPVTLATAINLTANQEADDLDALDDLRRFGDFPRAYWIQWLDMKNKTIADVVDDAMQGLLLEGTALGKDHEARWLAQQLRDVKHYGNRIKADYMPDIPSQIGETCIYLYTKESFLYKLINTVLRQLQKVSADQVKTLGPFCYLLSSYLYKIKTKDGLTVYRGLSLTDEQQQGFMKEKVKFTTFTSTSTKREEAEQFGNTLLIIDLNVKHGLHTEDNIRCGASISHLSDFPDEEEFLIWPATWFHFVKYEYDNTKKRHTIYLKSSSNNG